ncbi:MAG TPA: NUDIX domain-containing protein [Geminicoccus sp.]|uniref:NUDIX domain-containing protein n=1 Tax=Geminicoccus sp. TaxID=2024832 RepID=UPI002BDCE201|nr:NUDIX domain-containing protein [Geminicoccus sp.]HWL67705.1 NUDIX domain-containing protein [Geminicoccus sp.]
MTPRQPRRFQVLERQEVWRGFFSAEDLRIRHERFSGGEVECARELWRQRDAVAVLPYDPATDRVLLVEQFRAGAIDAPEGPWVLEAIAGMIDGEDGAEETARRESLEEAGLVLDHLEEVAQFLSSPGCTTERVRVFLGLTTLPKQGAVFGLAHEGEDILTHVMGFEAAMAGLAQGRILGVTALVGLQALALRRPALMAARPTASALPSPVAAD